MPLTPGTKLGPYEIVAPLGAGGMGEVYRARDTRLDRTVAIKILPAHLSKSPEAKLRFDREARAISSLNHPNICTLHDVGHQDGTDFLVMECLEGETLAKRLEKGSLPVDQVLKFGAQMADALDKAHRSGVVHRDLKPGNIILTPTGAKLLDFGLAKPSSPLASGATLTAIAVQSPVTEQGTIVGTFQYMSPEQIEGKELDGRSDIFSLGAVIYEMLTGQRAFQGKSQLSVASSILEKDPAPISSVKPTTPPALDHVIRRCLAKDPEERWQAARDLALELKWMGDPGTQTEVPAQPASKKSLWHLLGWGVASILGIGLVLSGFSHWGKHALTAAQVRFEVQPPPGTANFTLSPDGHNVAILAPGPDGRRMIWIRALHSVELRPLPGTENVLGPPAFWSPDGRSIAFQAGNKLKRINISGGPPQEICNAVGSVLGGSWNREDVIIFGTDGNGIMKVSAAGGIPSLVTSRNGRNEVHAFPTFLSDGRHFIYVKAPENPGIYVGSLDLSPDKQSSKQILPTSFMAVFAPSTDAGPGRLFFVREHSLLTQLFDDRRLELLGEPAPVADQVATYLISGSFSAAAGDILAFRAGSTGSTTSALHWFDRKGKDLGGAAEAGSFAYSDLALSPDGTRAAAARIDPMASGSGQNLWLLDLVHRLSSRFTFDLAPDFAPAWSSDGSKVAFAASREGGTGIYQKAANGGGKEKTLLMPTETDKFPNDWSRDGRTILYTQRDARTNADLWLLPVTADGSPLGTPTPFANSEFNEGQGQFSPDSHWIAYTSDESGRLEIYVQPFPAPPAGGSKTPVSRTGGSQPRWRRDGKELFYLSLDGNLMAADVSSGSEFKAATPKSLFQVVANTNPEAGSPEIFRWAVTPDGNRFLITSDKMTSEPITVVLNWSANPKPQ